ncbi:MAG: pseudoazurin [Marinovum sp.]|nr:pseudoazurin [Marinovum sp.]
MPVAINRRSFIAGGSATALFAPHLLRAETTDIPIVEMLNRHPENPKLRSVFTPRLLTVDAGQSVLFQATDNGHNSASVKGMIPKGAEAWKGKIGKDIEVTFSVPGFYGYVCTPHVSQGMVGMIAVRGDGMLDNLNAAQSVKHRGKAKGIFSEIWEEAEAKGLLS